MCVCIMLVGFFVQAEDGIRDLVRSRGLGDVYKRQVQETEYTGAGKHHWSQLNFARQMGVEVRAGDPRDLSLIHI